jgi:hypothetical protein
VYGKRDLSPNIGMAAQAAKAGAGPGGQRKPMGAKRKKK